MDNAHVSTVAQIIQLAIAPVFLLTGIGGILNVVASRLARVIDRVRIVETQIPSAEGQARDAQIAALAVADRRLHLCHWAIALCTIAALLVCLVIVVLFIADMMAMDFATPVSWLFVAAMASLTAGLLVFLTEVTIATRAVRVSKEFRTRGRPRHEP